MFKLILTMPPAPPSSPASYFENRNDRFTASKYYLKHLYSSIKLEVESEKEFIA